MPQTGALIAGQPLAGVELFGVAPDPTALVTLGLLLLLPGGVRWLLALIPLAWTVVSGSTFLAMEIPLGLLTPAAALAGVLAKWGLDQGRLRRAGTG